MERVIELAAMVRREVEDYCGPALGDTMYFYENIENQEYIVVTVPDYNPKRRDYATVVVMAHIVGDVVIVDEDITDRPLYKELMHAGIPREQIILAYAGETLPKTE